MFTLAVQNIFKSLCSNAAKKKEEEFCHEPKVEKTGSIAVYANKSYVMAKIHAADCPRHGRKMQ